MMKRLLKKLSNRAGASLVIAMVLALVAVFVGGSVLAAATVNGGRLKSRKVREQAYLSQRSAAAILSEKLLSTNLSLSIILNDEDGVTITAIGGEAEGRSAVTELFYETVAYKYLNTQQIGIEKVSWQNFRMDSTTGRPYYYDSMLSGQDYQSEFSLTDPFNGEGEDLLCRLRVDNASSTAEKERYTVYFTFPEDGQLRLKVRATQRHNTETGENLMTWSSPSIIKEGSDN